MCLLSVSENKKTPNLLATEGNKMQVLIECRCSPTHANPLPQGEKAGVTGIAMFQNLFRGYDKIRQVWGKWRLVRISYGANRMRIVAPLQSFCIPRRMTGFPNSAVRKTPLYDISPYFLPLVVFQALLHPPGVFGKGRAHYYSIDCIKKNSRIIVELPP